MTGLADCLERIRDRVQPGSNLRTRLAPSPNGRMHAGHVVHSIYVCGLAHLLGATVQLRFEDHDRQRCRPEFEQAWLEDLQWLGLSASFAESFSELSGGEPSDLRQSDRLLRYHEEALKLYEQGQVYVCSCSRRTLRERTSHRSGELVYDGHCRPGRALAGTDERGVNGAVDLPAGQLRLVLPEDSLEFADGFCGPQRQTPALQCGDLALRDNQGNWTYQFAAVLDDLDQQINLVIRGADLLPSTGRQILLGRILGRREDAVYGHHPLLLDEAGRKHSKQRSSEPIAEARARGDSAEVVLGRAVTAMGLDPNSSPNRALSWPDVRGLFEQAARNR